MVYRSEVLNIAKSYPNLDIVMKLCDEKSPGNFQATSVLQKVIEKGADNLSSLTLFG